MVNFSFMARSPFSAKVENDAGIVTGSRGQTGMKTMRLIAPFGRYATLLRDFVATRYHPERHYMRGPGPACSRRHHKAHDLSLAD